MNDSPNLSGPAADYIRRHVEQRIILWIILAWGLGVSFGISLCSILLSLYP